jgi:hypothetical protein
MTTRKAKGKATSAAEAVRDVMFDRSRGLLVARSLGVDVCACCGEITIAAYDKTRNAFALMPLAQDVALKMAEALLTAVDTSREIETRTASDDKGRPH